MTKQEESNYKGKWIVKNNGNPFFIEHNGEGLPYAVKVVDETTSLGVPCLVIKGGYVVAYEDVSIVMRPKSLEELEDSK